MSAASAKRGCQDGRRKSCNISGGAIGANIVLVGSELTAFSGDTLQVLLSRGIGIANLQKKALLANRLAVELLDDLFTDLTSLKAVNRSVSPQMENETSIYRAKPTPRLMWVWGSRRILLELTV